MFIWFMKSKPDISLLGIISRASFSTMCAKLLKIFEGIIFLINQISKHSQVHFLDQSRFFICVDSTLNCMLYFNDNSHSFHKTLVRMRNVTNLLFYHAGMLFAGSTMQSIINEFVILFVVLGHALIIFVLFLKKCLR